MLYTIKIYDFKNSQLENSLDDVLRCLDDKAHSLHWSLVYLYASGDMGPGKSIQDFEKEVKEAPQGLSISFSGLQSLANKLTEIIDIVIAGNLSAKEIVEYDDDESFYKNNEITIEFYDSAYWIISTSDENIISRIKERFKEVEVRELE